MTLALVLFILAVLVIALISIPITLLASEIEDLWANVRFWVIVAASWLAVWFAVSYG